LLTPTWTCGATLPNILKRGGEWTGRQCITNITALSATVIPHQPRKNALSSQSKADSTVDRRQQRDKKTSKFLAGETRFGWGPPLTQDQLGVCQGRRRTLKEALPTLLPWRRIASHWDKALRVLGTLCTASTHSRLTMLHIIY
jgi:hypothetical protein